MISKKAVLVGHFNVGKSSLVRQFVHSKFSDDYITTIGVNIEKKQVDVGGNTVNIILWDTAGEESVTKIPKSYLLGAHGVIYVFDLARPSTYENIEQDVNDLRNIIPNIPVVVIGNKNDLLPKEEVEKIMAGLGVPCELSSSAKTGVNVEEAFLSLAQQMIG